MWAAIGDLLLLLVTVGAFLFVLVILAGIWEGLRNTERWREAAADAKARTEHIKDIRRQAEAAFRDCGTRTFE